MHLYTRIFIKITKSSIIRGTSSCYEIHGILLLKNRERDSIHYEFVVPLPSLFTMLRIVDSLANRTVLATQLAVLVEFLVEILSVGATPTCVVRWLSFRKPLCWGPTPTCVIRWLSCRKPLWWGPGILIFQVSC